MNDHQGQTTIATTANRPNPEGYASWNEYWKAQRMSWRTEPEIDEERQRFLTERRAIPPDIKKGIYPFKDIKLVRADVEWLLATHESGGMRGPVDWSDEAQRSRDGLDVRGADLRRAELHALPLARLRGGHVFEEQWTTPWLDDDAVVHLEESDLRETHLEGALLDNALMQRADLAGAHLQSAQLGMAHLEGAHLGESHLEGANLTGAHLHGALLRWTHLGGADLAGAHFDTSTVFWRTSLSSPQEGSAILRDVVWGGANLSYIDWADVRILGDEHLARQPTVLPELMAFGMTQFVLFEAAVRANQQLALALRAQGMSDWADHFAYCAQALQRHVLRRQGRLLRYFGSLLLALTSGYGYRPLRSVVTYLLVVLGFAVGYYLLGGSVHPSLSVVDAVIFSVTSFHGRGFTPGEAVTLYHPLTILAAGEAVIGLLIEITFIGAIRSLETVARRRGMRGIPTGVTTGGSLTGANSCPSW